MRTEIRDKAMTKPVTTSVHAPGRFSIAPMLDWTYFEYI